MSKGFRELSKLFPDFSPVVAVDVGANVGRTTLEIADAARYARVFAFEPIQKSFDQLSEATSGRSNIVAERLALGSTDINLYMTSRGTSNGNQIVI